MPIGICLQFSIRRHARRIGAFRKCERIGRGFAKRLAGSDSPSFERWRSQRAANLQPRSEIGAKPETVRCLRGLLLTAESGRCEEGILRSSLPPQQTLRFGLRMGFTLPQRLFRFRQIWPRGSLRRKLRTAVRIDPTGSLVISAKARSRRQDLRDPVPSSRRCRIRPCIDRQRPSTAPLDPRHWRRGSRSGGSPRGCRNN